MEEKHVRPFHTLLCLVAQKTILYGLYRFSFVAESKQMEPSTEEQNKGPLLLLENCIVLKETSVKRVNTIDTKDFKQNCDTEQNPRF